MTVHVLDGLGRTIGVTSVPPERASLLDLAARVAVGEEVTAVIESMTGARFVHDSLELAGWDVLIADAARARALAPLAAKTDKIDAWVLAELGRRDLVPEIWLPDLGVRSARELCRFRQHLVGHRSALKNRIHATLVTFGHPVAMTDLFGAAGRAYLATLEIPEPWCTTVARSLELIEETQARIEACERELLARSRRNPAVQLLITVPGIGLILASIIAAALGTSGGSPRPSTSSGTPGSARTFASRVVATTGDRSPRTGPSSCAGRSSKRPPTPVRIPDTTTTTSRRARASASGAVPPSPGSSSRAPSPPPSGTCSPRTKSSPRQVPYVIWSLDDPE
jgi:transposase